MDIIYGFLGLLIVAYQAVGSTLESLAALVGGGGVFAALVCAFLALVVAHRADDRAETLAKKVEELEEKLEDLEDRD